jgi:hypothetical protein
MVIKLSFNIANDTHSYILVTLMKLIYQYEDITEICEHSVSIWL